MLTATLLAFALLAPAETPSPWSGALPRTGGFVSAGLGVGATITSAASRFGNDGYLTNGRLDVTVGQGLTDRVTLGLVAHYTPHFHRRLRSSQGVGARVAVFVWRGLFVSLAPGVDWIPDRRDPERMTVAPGAYGTAGWQWALGQRLGLAFDVGMNLRGVPADGGFIVGGFNRLALTWYRR